MDDITLLSDVLGKTADLVDGVTPNDWSRATPCTEFTVKDLVGHMVAVAISFDAAANGRAPEGDPSGYEVTDESATEFRTAVDGILGGWSANGTDRMVSLTGAGEMPGSMVFDMTFMEYLAHGWDLATATGQPMLYTDDEAQAVLELGQKHLTDQWRGEGKAFAHVVDISASAPAIDRFAGFMGRRP